MSILQELKRIFFGLTELEYTERSYTKHKRRLYDGISDWDRWYVERKLKRIEARLIWLWSKRGINRAVKDLDD
jgi:hypothetical protein